MNTTYENKKLHAGRDNKGHQRHRLISVRTTEVNYELSRIVETRKVWDEESERWHTEKVERRPHMHVTTKVVCSKNRFGLIRLYGTQGA